MSRTFPRTDEYIAAIENAQTCVLDPVLQKGYPKRRQRDNELLYYAGGFARVFVIHCHDKAYALRCWVNDIGDTAERYHAVSACLGQTDLPHFADFEYVEEGIRVGKDSYPIMRMEWVEAPSLHEFISQHRHQSRILAAAAESFLTMVQTLHEREIAHGDLQNENVKVRMNGAGPEFVLIDYDTLFVPGLRNTWITTTGVPGFQHPKRESVATRQDDYFAELVIYLTLRAIAQEPRLWDDFRMEEREKELIFDGTDFNSEVPTETFRRLRRLSPPVDKLTLLLWNFTRCRDIRWLIPLEQAETLCRTGHATPSSKRWLEEWRGVPPPLPKPPPVPTRPPAPPPGSSFVALLKDPQPAAPRARPPKPGYSRFDDLLKGRQPGASAGPPPPPKQPAGKFDEMLQAGLVTPEPEPQPPPDEAAQPSASDATPSRQVIKLLLIILLIILLLALLHGLCG